MKEINILGTTYKLYENVDPKELPEGMGGLTELYSKNIKIVDYSKFDCDTSIELVKQTIRHELVHAFLFESGLAGNSFQNGAWADNEEIVDWIAMQTPKMFKLFKELDIL